MHFFVFEIFLQNLEKWTKRYSPLIYSSIKVPYDTQEFSE